ncbi:MAG: hypothetical protein NUV49_00815 [Patescibacteria group bacterium]|nr:hypothetical protein [Patescibacteria group bacterium]
MQKYKTYNLVILVITVVFLVGIYIYWKLTAVQCWDNPIVFCAAEGFEEKFHPLLWSFLTLFLVTLPLFIVRRGAFIAWAKFAVVAFPLMLGILLYTFNNTPVTGSWISGPTDDQLASVLLPSLFVIISFAIIALKSAEFSVGLSTYVRLILKYSGLTMIILPTLFILAVFIWWFGVVVLGM